MTKALLLMVTGLFALACRPGKQTVEEKLSAVKEVFAAFPLEQIEELTRIGLTIEERDQLVQNNKSANWKIETIDEVNHKLEIVPASSEETTYSKIAFGVYVKPQGGVDVVVVTTPATSAEDFKSWFFEGTTTSTLELKFEQANDLPGNLILGDFVAEKIGEGYAKRNPSSYLRINLQHDTIHYSIDDIRFFIDFEAENQGENAEYYFEEYQRESFLKYEYDFVWSDGKFVKHKSIRKGYDSLPAEVAEEASKTRGDWTDCSDVFRVMASNELASQGTSNYSIENVKDNDDQTVWSSPGNGIGQWIEFELTRETTYAGQYFKIRNGHAKNENLWKANSRVKKMKVELNGRVVCHVTLLDINADQTFDIHAVPKPGEPIRFTIEEIYRGDKYEDTVISHFFSRGNCW